MEYQADLFSYWALKIPIFRRVINGWHMVERQMIPSHVMCLTSSSWRLDVSSSSTMTWTFLWHWDERSSDTDIKGSVTLTWGYSDVDMNGPVTLIWTVQWRWHERSCDVDMNGPVTLIWMVLWRWQERSCDTNMNGTVTLILTFLWRWHVWLLILV
jgi:hypothetical protein